MLWGIPLAAAVSALWYGPVIARHGWTFVDEFFIQHHFARYVSNKYHHPQPIYFYPAIILMLALPWTAFLVEALAKIRSWAWRENDEPEHLARVFARVVADADRVLFVLGIETAWLHIARASRCRDLLISDRLLHSQARWPVRTTGVICLALAVGGIVYAVQSGEISIACAVAIAAPHGWLLPRRRSSPDRFFCAIRESRFPS